MPIVDELVESYKSSPVQGSAVSRQALLDATDSYPVELKLYAPPWSGQLVGELLSRVPTGIAVSRPGRSRARHQAQGHRASGAISSGSSVFENGRRGNTQAYTDRRINPHVATCIERAITLLPERGAATAVAYLAHQGISPDMILRVLSRPDMLRRKIDD